MCCPFFHKSLPNCTSGNNFIWTSLRTEHLSGTEQRDSNRVFYTRIVRHQWIFTLTQLPTSYTQTGPSPQVALCSCGVEHLCQSANIRPLFRKKKMPNACRTHGAGTLTNLSLSLSRKRLGLVYETVDAFQALNSPSLSPQTGCSCRPLTSSPLEVGWKLLHQKSSQSLSLLPGVDAIQLNA